MVESGAHKHRLAIEFIKGYLVFGESKDRTKLQIFVYREYVGEVQDNSLDKPRLITCLSW